MRERQKESLGETERVTKKRLSESLRETEGALSAWTRQLCLSDIEAMSTTRVVDLLPVLLLIALVG